MDFLSRYPSDEPTIGGCWTGLSVSFGKETRADGARGLVATRSLMTEDRVNCQPGRL